MKQANKFVKGQVVKNGKLVYSSIVVNASPSEVWKVLLNFSEYPSWNPFIRSVSGETKVGNKIAVVLSLAGKKDMKFIPTVLVNNYCREFRWIGNLVVPYLFDGEHAFVLEDNENGTTTFHHYEFFRGLLVPFMKKTLEVDTLRGFEAMNIKLKEEVEKRIAQ